MGVFARLRRKSKRAEGEAGSASPAAGPVADRTPAPEAPEAVRATVADSEATGVGNGGTTTAEGVDIPKQQTADEAADNEAGEGARA
ncbi:hypothetical protein [Streptomyces sp. NBC_01506]|uniref:hypothetical protein n=1 Tax=Streptomyces sp. NBC_01506 TaxID=2903887 RepID=UPI0038704AC7